RLKLDQESLDKLRQAYATGSVPERSVREAERNVEADLIAVARAERTLRSWRLTEAEIAAVKAEANVLKAPGSAAEDERWARVEIRAPQSGVILEKNLSLGDLVDTNIDLFRIGDVRRLTVWAHAYEEDLPKLNSLTRPIDWTVVLPA